jgi:DNA-binding GntR family transcriptional regulator
MSNLEIITRATPVSEQVYDLLRSRILNGHYPAETRMPSEDRLAGELNVSRATIRSALAALASEKLVSRRQGDGTYPTPHVLEVTVRTREVWNVERQIQSSGRQPSIQVLEQGIRIATAQEQAGLALDEGEPVFAIRRLFLADGKPVMAADHILNPKNLSGETLSAAAHLPLLEFLSRSVERPLGMEGVHFKAVLAWGEIAQTLQVEVDSPLLLMQAVLQDRQNSPLLLAWEYYRGDEGFLLPIGSL